jgi:hypothetical protein
MRPTPSLSPLPFTLNPPAQAKPAYGMSPLLEVIALAGLSAAVVGEVLPSDTLRTLGDTFHKSR